MKQGTAHLAPAAEAEITALIEGLNTTGRRLEALTGGEIDSVVDRDGRTFLLRHVQEQLRDGEAATRAAILNSLPAHVALLDAQGLIVAVNAAWARFAQANLLQGPRDALGSSYLDVCDQASAAGVPGASEVATAIRSVLAGGPGGPPIEYPCHSPAEERWFLMTMTPLAEDRRAGAVVMHFDITARKRHETEMLRLGAAMDAVADAIYLVDRDTLEFLHVNDAACRMQGMTRAQLLELGPARLQGVEPADLARAYDSIIALETDPAPVEILRPNAQGEPVWIELRRHATRNGDRWTVVTLVRDIDERKRVSEDLQRSESLKRSILKASLDCLVTIDEAGLIVEFNPAAEATFGWTRAQACGKPMVDLIIPQRLREDHRQGVARYLAGGEGPMLGRRVELSAMRADGTEFPIELVVAALEGTAKPMFTGFIRDITLRKEADAKLRGLNRVYAVLSGINALIVRASEPHELFREACRIAVEAGGFRMAMIVLAQPEGVALVPVASAGKGEDLMDDVRAMLASPQASRTMIARALATAEAVVANDSRTDASVLLGPRYAEAQVQSIAVLPLVVAEVVVGAIALYSEELGFFDEDEMKLLTELAGDIAFAIDHIGKQDLLQYLAYYDSLTGLANRTLFLERVAQSLNVAAGGGYTPAVFLVDLEHFKDINDSLGRPAGDVLLRQVSEWLTTHVGDAARLARLGADHFALVLPEAKTEGDVANVLEDILTMLPAHPFQLNGADYRISARIGVAVFPGDGADADTLFRHAEAALKKAKSSGERYLFYAERMTAAVAGRLSLENRLRQALVNREFVLHYQPKVSLGDGSVTGCEALIRWNDPQAGLVPPAQFIPLLEETGLIDAVGRWALDQALEDYRRWKAAGLPAPRIAVNISPLQLRHRGFVDQIREATAGHSGAAGGLELELTESLVMEDVELSIASLQAIRALGVRVAIDDFGTGFSSLSYLARLPVDTLKIDRSFVVDMTAGPRGLALVSTIINLAHSLKLCVVAEGVETQEQSRLLRLLGCDQMQGYLFSKPVPAAVYESLFLGRAGGKAPAA